MSHSSGRNNSERETKKSLPLCRLSQQCFTTHEHQKAGIMRQSETTQKGKGLTCANYNVLGHL